MSAVCGATEPRAMESVGWEWQHLRAESVSLWDIIMAYVFSRFAPFQREMGLGLEHVEGSPACVAAGPPAGVVVTVLGAGRAVVF